MVRSARERHADPRQPEVREAHLRSAAAEIDDEVRQLIGECYEKSKELLNENRAILDRIAGILREKESITGKEFMEVYNEMKGIAPEDETASETGSVTADEI